MTQCHRCGKPSCESYVEGGVAISKCISCSALQIELTSIYPDLRVLKRYRLSMIRERVRERTGEGFLDEPDEEFQEEEKGE